MKFTINQSLNKKIKTKCMTISYNNKTIAGRKNPVRHTLNKKEVYQQLGGGQSNSP